MKLVARRINKTHLETIYERTGNSKHESELSVEEVSDSDKENASESSSVIVKNRKKHFQRESSFEGTSFYKITIRLSYLYLRLKKRLEVN